MFQFAFVVSEVRRHVRGSVPWLCEPCMRHPLTSFRPQLAWKAQAVSAGCWALSGAQDSQRTNDAIATAAMQLNSGSFWW
jgi:hypothetical protein